MIRIDHDPMEIARREGWFSRGASRRRGLSQVEVLVAAGLAIVALTFLPRIGYQLQRITRESKEFQIAVQELANQLERLTRGDSQGLEEALERLEVAPNVRESLDGARLAGRVSEDRLGKRIELSLQWVRRGDPPPVTLVGWVVTDPVAPTKNSGEGS